LPSAPSRFEVEHLHRLMIQASAEAARLEGRLGEAQTADGLWPLLRHWHEAAGGLDQALARARGPLEQEGTPKDQIDRIRKRAEQRGERDRARARYERLRQAWLAAQRDWEAAQPQHVSEPGVQQHEVRKPPVPDLRQDATSPVIVRLPQPTLPERKAPARTGPAASKLPLNRLLERGHHRADAVAARMEKTLSHLATAEHRTLTDPTAGELRAHLARMDSVLARLSGKRGDELRDGAREVSTLLHRMSAIATRAGASAHVAPFRKLMEERKGQLRRLAQDSGGQPRQAALWPPLPARDPGHPLRELRGSHPGLDRIHAADRADQIHDHLEIGIDAAQKLNQKVGATHDLLETIPGIEEEGEEGRAYLEGGRRKRSPHGHAEPPEAQVALPQETEEQRAARLRRAWEWIGSVSSQVQRFELEPAKAQRRIEELLREGKANEASMELMGLGSRCEQIDRTIREAKTLSRGHEKYEKEVGFYEDWHRRIREKLHARIADTEGLGGQVAISGFGIQESTHPDIFENTRAIYAVRTKVQSFAGALHDPDASGQVRKVLAEARKAKSELQALKAKHRKDKAAHEFLTGGGVQDKLIDEALQKLAGAGKAAQPKVAKVAGVAEHVSEMFGEDSALGQLAQQLGDGAGRDQGKLHEVLDPAGKGKRFLHRGEEVFERVLELAEGHHAKEIGKGAVHELREAPHEGWDLTAENAQVAFESLDGLQAQRRGGDRDAPRIETGGGLTTPVSSDRDRERHDPFSDLLDDMFAGGDARIHVDRGGARLDQDEVDLQDVDPAAMDTWIGSGEAVKLFSEVFGAFIPAEAAIVVHAGRGGGDGQGKGSEPAESPRRHRRRKQRGGFFARLFDQLEGFADRIGGWAKKGSRLLGKGMHFAELGMHGLSQIEGAAERVEGFAGKSEGLLERMGLHRLAGYAGWMGARAAGVDEEAKLLHGGLRTADQWMSKKATGGLEQGAHAAAGIFDEGGQGRSGALVNIFRASRNGDGIDGKLSPDRVPLGSAFDEPRRLDVSTLSRMGSFLGGDFSGVRIHTGPGAAEVTRRFNAEAVTVKDHIFFAPGRFNPTSVEGQKLIAHELTHVLQKGRANLDVRTAEGEALHSEHSYGPSPSMETLNLRRPEPGFRLAADGEGMGASSGIHTAKRTRSRGDETGSKDTLPDGEELLEQVSGRVYELLMEELEQGFQSR